MPTPAPAPPTPSAIPIASLPGVSGWSGFVGASGYSGFSGTSGLSGYGTPPTQIYPIRALLLPIGQCHLLIADAIEMYGSGILTREEIREAIDEMMEAGNVNILPHLPMLVDTKIWSQDEARRQIGLDILE